MKAFFGVVALLVAVAVMGLVVGRQFKAVRAGAAAAGASSAASGTASAPARTVPDQVRTDVTRALEQGARRDEAAP